MSVPSRPLPAVERAAALDRELLRSGSVLIYCRSSAVLSTLVFAGLLAKVYSDLYVHLIRRTARDLAGASVPALTLFALLLAGSVFLAFRAKPRLEKAALLILATNLAVFLLRGEAAVSSVVYRALCVVSLLLDLGLLYALVAFYRRYPNVLQLLRSRELSGEDDRATRPGRTD